MLVCALSTNVLLLSGYWPVIGTAIAVITRSGFVCILAPEDEEDLAQRGWADAVQTFSPGSLDEIGTIEDAVRAPLTDILKKFSTERRMVVACEQGSVLEPASYVGMHLFGTTIQRLLSAILPDAAILSADELLARLRSILSPFEQSRVREACDFAAAAFFEGFQCLRPGLSEVEAAAGFRRSLSVVSDDSGARAGGFVFCMSGPNSAKAYAAYQRSHMRKIEPGDLVLVHCNSYLDGYWTDITRTFCLSRLDQQTRQMYEAIFAARRAALDIIRPEVKAADVDHAARAVLSRYGFAEGFKHGLGHGVGFAAINHNAPPRLHPASNDRLESGMVFNIEPAIYLDGLGGIRHCDMVLVTEDGLEVLTPFQSTLDNLTVHD